MRAEVVTDVLGEINAASSEPAAVVVQIWHAVTQMDHATQQDAALVEKMAADASSLKAKAKEPVQTVAVIYLRKCVARKQAATRTQAPRAAYPTENEALALTPVEFMFNG